MGQILAGCFLVACATDWLVDGWIVQNDKQQSKTVLQKEGKIEESQEAEDCQETLGFISCLLSCFF